MTDDTDTAPGAGAVPGAPELQTLGVQVESMQALLVSLLQEVVHAETRLARTQAAVAMAEVNEELLLSALNSRAEAQAAAQALQDATRAALSDPLTALPNRAGLLGRFEQALANARRHQGRCALLFVDLDNFKHVNDRRGHGFGDQVLKLAAGRLAAGVREVDTVSRHGGDEFLVLLSELAEPGDVQRVADKLVAALAVPAEVDGVTVRLSASAGAATYPDDGDTFEALVAHADAAMYERKRRRLQDAVGQAAARADRGAGTTAASAPVAAAPGEAAAAAGAPAAGSDAHSPRQVQRLLADLREVNEQLVLAAIDARELRTAAELARQRQSAFLAAVAEELRNPMAPVRIATMMLGRPAAADPLLPQVQRLVGSQLAQIARLVDAINLDSGGMQLQRERVDLGAVVDAAVGAVRPRCREREQTLAWQRPAAALEVPGDAARLALVVANLLDNACRYTPERGHVWVGLAPGPGTVTLTVTDDGMGIAPALLPVIFDPFVQDPRALAFNGNGLGIGLTVARALVRAHGGRIAVLSDGPRRGTRVVVELPQAPASDAADAPDAADATRDARAAASPAAPAPAEPPWAG